MAREERTHERIADLLNGDWDEMDAVTRRALVALSYELDSVHDAVRGVQATLTSVIDRIDESARRQRQSFVALGAAFISSAATVLVAVIR